MKTFKIILLSIICMIIIGCASPNPIDYYNEVKLNFGQDCIISQIDEYYNTLLVKDSDCNIWKVVLFYRKIEGEPIPYIYSKELIF